MAKRWIIPDIHGCSKTLKCLLERQLNITKHDTIYFLGDYIDRGPDGKGTLDYLMRLEKEEYDVYFIKGNHEDMCVKAYYADQKRRLLERKKPEQKMWEDVGASETLISFGVKHPREIPQKYIEWMEKCMPYIELEHYILVHAGMDFDRKNPFDDVSSMMWTRNFKVNYDKSHGKRVIHGHVPVDYSFMQLVIDQGDAYDFIALDNGVFYKDTPEMGNLVAFNPDTRELIATPNLDY